MGYIRSNEDYYTSQGMSSSQAKKQVAKDKALKSYDPGFCNPRKAKEYAEAEEEFEKSWKE